MLFVKLLVLSCESVRTKTVSKEYMFDNLHLWMMMCFFFMMTTDDIIIRDIGTTTKPEVTDFQDLCLALDPMLQAKQSLP